MNIGSAIRILRKERGLSQGELAKKCGISVNAMSQIETNASFPQKNTIVKICDMLEIPVSYLLFFSISDEDVPEDKRNVFQTLNGMLKSVLIQSINSDK